MLPATQCMENYLYALKNTQKNVSKKFFWGKLCKLCIFSKKKRAKRPYFLHLRAPLGLVVGRCVRLCKLCKKHRLYLDEV